MLSALLRKRAIEIGFDLAGIAPIDAWNDLAFSRRWVEQGYGGEMRYLENPKRHDPRSVLPSVKSVICVGHIYNAPLPYSEEVRSGGSDVGTRGWGKTNPEPSFEPRTPNPEPRAWISRYGWGHDYHDVMRKNLEQLRRAVEEAAPGAETKVYVDTGPVVERAFARLSGIGWTGKNTCLINEQKGSWFFLSVILTSLELAPDLPAPDRCGSCTRCIEACPTDALVEPYVMDASRCIAYLTIELKGSIPAEFRPAIGNNVFGCDICQDVCPWNSRSQESGARSQNAGSPEPSAVSGQPELKGLGRCGAATTALPEFQPLELTLPIPAEEPRTSNFEPRTFRPESRAPNPELRTFSLFHPRLEELAALSEEDFRRAFARSPIKRTKYRGWLRNLCVAMGNSGDRRYVPQLREYSRHADPLIREHADWALNRLQSAPKPKT